MITTASGSALYLGGVAIAGVTSVDIGGVAIPPDAVGWRKRVALLQEPASISFDVTFEERPQFPGPRSHHEGRPQVLPVRHGILHAGGRVCRRAHALYSTGAAFGDAQEMAETGAGMKSPVATGKRLNHGLARLRSGVC